jgi:hypothetical protein
MPVCLGGLIAGLNGTGRRLQVAAQQENLPTA